LLQEAPDLAAALRARWRCISVDEYQDTDADQYALLRLLAGDGSGLAVIGDPDQAIYGFRGADVGFFLSFERDYPGARTVALTRNYRSSPVIVSGAMQAVAPTTLVPDRRLGAAAGGAGGMGRGAGGRGGRGGGAGRALPPRAGSSSMRPPPSRPRRRGSRGPSTGCWAVRRSIRWTPAGPTATRSAGWRWPIWPCSTAPMPRPRRSARH